VQRLELISSRKLMMKKAIIAKLICEDFSATFGQQQAQSVPGILSTMRP
jgi:hypothetical protein